MPPKSSSRKNKFKAAPYLLNAIVFFMQGIGTLEQEGFYFALVLFFVSLVNLLVIKTSDRNLANSIVMILNSVVALVLAVQLFAEGKNYIQYVWIAVCVLSAIVAFIAYRKYKTARSAQAPAPAEEEPTME